MCNEQKNLPPCRDSPVENILCSSKIVSENTVCIIGKFIHYTWDTTLVLITKQNNILLVVHYKYYERIPVLLATNIMYLLLGALGDVSLDDLPKVWKLSTNCI